MSMSGNQDTLRPVTRMGQIIVGALITGVSIFLIVAVVIDLEPNRGPARPAAADGDRGPAVAKTDAQIPFPCP
jgi:hypothetical protein